MAVQSRASLRAAALLIVAAAATAPAAGAAIIGGVTASSGDAFDVVTAPPGTASLSAWLAQRAAAGAVPLAAWGTFDDTINATGWSTLEVFSNGSFPDLQQARAAGYWEGAITQRRMWEFAYNVNGATSRWSPQLTEFVHANVEWMRATAPQRCGAQPFWHSVATQLEQWEGLYAGYAAAAPPEQALDRDTLYASTLIGDMDDLCVVFGCVGRHAPRGSPPVKAPYLGVGGHCSVLIKPLGPPGAPTDFIMGHTTWSPYETMTRVWKRYSLPLRSTCAAGASLVPAVTMSFPSYPGALFSNDDLYVTSAGLVITETTIHNNNASLWAAVTPQTVPNWARNVGANRLATTGPEWVQVYSMFASGTYNNEWMVWDSKLFTPGKPLADNTLVVLEQMPGIIEWSDHTPWLRAEDGGQGYWASYNRPSFPRIFEVSNQSALVAAYGPHYTWNETARAQIFRREQGGVTDGASFARLLRYNEFRSDPTGPQGCPAGSESATNAISERGDLTPAGSGCIPTLTQLDQGGTDAKYTTWSALRAGTLAVAAQSGPTYDAQPPFVWSASPFAAIPHVGQPDKWAFPWVTMAFEVEGA